MDHAQPIDVLDLAACDVLTDVAAGVAEPAASDVMLNDPSQLPAGYIEQSVADLATLARSVPKKEREQFLLSLSEAAPNEAWKKIIAAHLCSENTLEFVVRAGLDPIFELVANGISVVRICSVLTLSYSTLMQYIYGDADRVDRYERAKLYSAEAFADKAGDVLESGEELDRDKERAKHYRWLAERRGPKEFMPKPTAEAMAAVSQSVSFVWNAPTPPTAEQVKNLVGSLRHGQTVEQAVPS